MERAFSRFLAAVAGFTMAGVAGALFIELMDDDFLVFSYSRVEQIFVPVSLIACIVFALNLALHELIPNWIPPDVLRPKVHITEDTLEWHGGGVNVAHVTVPAAVMVGGIAIIATESREQESIWVALGAYIALGFLLWNIFCTKHWARITPETVEKSVTWFPGSASYTKLEITSSVLYYRNVRGFAFPTWRFVGEGARFESPVKEVEMQLPRFSNLSERQLAAWAEANLPDFRNLL